MELTPFGSSGDGIQAVIFTADDAQRNTGRHTGRALPGRGQPTAVNADLIGTAAFLKACPAVFDADHYADAVASGDFPDLILLQRKGQDTLRRGDFSPRAGLGGQVRHQQNRARQDGQQEDYQHIPPPQEGIGPFLFLRLVLFPCHHRMHPRPRA